MTTVVDICNLALSRIGDRATITSISPPEGSAQADHCARFWPMARDTALESKPWRFAAARAELALTDYPTANWSYAYFLPSDCLLARRVFPPTVAPSSSSSAIFAADELGDDFDIRFDLETDASGRVVLLTNEETATLLYTRRVTDPAKFTANFSDAVTWLLASYIAGPVLKGQVGEKAAARCYQAYLSTLDRAGAQEVNQSNIRRNYVPTAMAARNVAFGNNRRVGR